MCSSDLALRLDQICPRKLRQRSFGPDLAQDDSSYGLRRGFSVSDGIRTYPVTLLGDGQSLPYLAVFPRQLPSADTELWVTDASGMMRIEPPNAKRGIICFASGTRLRTVLGEIAVEDLRPGHLVLTRDDGPQEVIWIGSTHISGARLHLDPASRPIQINARALGDDLPDAELLVSPRHRLLLRGRAARILFNSDEVLARAGDLVNDLTIRQVTPRRRLTYYHVLLPRHEVVWANGMPCESFHPDDMDLSVMAESQRAELCRFVPGIERNPGLYGAAARRLLSAAEVAIYQHGRHGAHRG